MSFSRFGASKPLINLRAIRKSTLQAAAPKVDLRGVTNKNIGTALQHAAPKVDLRGAVSNKNLQPALQKVAIQQYGNKPQSQSTSTNQGFVDPNTDQFVPASGGGGSGDFGPQGGGGPSPEELAAQQNEELRLVQQEDQAIEERLNQPDAAMSPEFAPEDDNFRRGISDFDGEQPSISAYMHRGQLCTLGVCDTPYGTVPVSHAIYVGKHIPDGPVQIGNDPVIANAMMQSVNALDRKANRTSKELAIEGIVKRTRAGDQVATDTIGVIRAQAEQGHPAAIEAHRMVNTYIATHPYNGPFGNESMPHEAISGTVMKNAIMLADGPPLSRRRINSIASIFGADATDERKLFFFAIANYMNGSQLRALAQRVGEWGSKVLALGKGIGAARAIQMVRDPSVPISKVQPNVGYELGE